MPSHKPQPVDFDEGELQGQEEVEDIPTKKIEIEEQSSHNDPIEELDLDNWFGPEGELAIDVYQTPEHIVIQSAIAGVKTEELDITVENDVVTIKGNRKNPTADQNRQYLHEECYWGPFSRQVFLPEDVDVKNVEAAMKDGVLTLKLPRTRQQQSKKVTITKN